MVWQSPNRDNDPPSMSSDGGEGKLIKVLKFLKIPRLLRLARLRRILKGKGKYVRW